MSDFASAGTRAGVVGVDGACDLAGVDGLGAAFSPKKESIVLIRLAERPTLGLDWICGRARYMTRSMPTKNESTFLTSRPVAIAYSVVAFSRAVSIMTYRCPLGGHWFHEVSSNTLVEVVCTN